jgi:flagellar FliL protein
MAIDNQFEREEEEDLEDELLDDGLSDDDGFSAKKIILMVVLPLFILAGAGSGLYFTGALDNVIGGEKKEEQAESAGYSEEGGTYGSAHFLEIPNMIVNLNSPDGQPRYLRLSVQLEMESSTDVSAVEAVMPRVIDQFQTYLREL